MRVWWSTTQPSKRMRSAVTRIEPASMMLSEIHQRKTNIIGVRLLLQKQRSPRCHRAHRPWDPVPTSSLPACVSSVQARSTAAHQRPSEGGT